MMTASLGDLRNLARLRADLQNDNHVTDQECNLLINDSAQEFYQNLVDLSEAYMPVTVGGVAQSGSFTFQTTNNQAYYALPSDFYHLRGVEAALDSVRWISLRTHDFSDRNIYSLAALPIGVAPYGAGIRYRLEGDQIAFIPYQNLPSGLNIRLWYYPNLPVLVNDTDVMSVVGGFRDYIVTDVAIKLRDIQESDTSVLMAQKAALLERIRRQARDRDKSQPKKALSPYRRGRNRGGGF